MLIFDEILSKGFNAQHFISSLSSHLRDLIVSRTAGLDALLDLPASLKQRYRQQAESCTLQFLYDALSITTQCEAGYKAAINQRLHIEFALMKLAFLSKGVPGSAAAVPAGSRTASDPSHASMGPSLPHTSGPEARVAEQPKPEAEAQAPEAKPAPRRRPAKTGASLSLGAIMGGPEEKKPEAPATGTPQEDLIDERIYEKWKEMPGLYPKQTRLANAMANAKVEISREDGLTVTFIVTNDAQRSWIESNKLHELEGRFQELLGRSGVKLRVAAAQYEEEKVIYTPEDKAKYLMANNQEVIDIISDLGLDLK